MAFITIVSSGFLFAVPGRAQVASSVDPTRQDEVQRHLPEHAVITSRLKLNFQYGVRPDAEAVVFTLPPVYAGPYDAGLRILGREAHSKWKVLYAEDSEFGPGEDQIILDRVKAHDGPEALVVTYYHASAGTTTDWKIIAAQSGKLRSVDSRTIRDRVLKERHSTFGGYNAVKVEGDIIAERIPMYSQNTARCCPDRPPIEMRVRFTGRGLQLESVVELPADK